jgi:hypothetical protein
MKLIPGRLSCVLVALSMVLTAPVLASTPERFGRADWQLITPTTALIYLSDPTPYSGGNISGQLVLELVGENDAAIARFTADGVFSETYTVGGMLRGPCVKLLDKVRVRVVADSRVRTERAAPEATVTLKELIDGDQIDTRVTVTIPAASSTSKTALVAFVDPTKGIYRGVLDVKIQARKRSGSVDLPERWSTSLPKGRRSVKVHAMESVDFTCV